MILAIGNRACENNAPSSRTRVIHAVFRLRRVKAEYAAPPPPVIGRLGGGLAGCALR